VHSGGGRLEGNHTAGDEYLKGVNQWRGRDGIEAWRERGHRRQEVRKG